MSRIVSGVKEVKGLRRIFTKDKYCISVETYGYYLLEEEKFYFSNLTEAGEFRKQLIRIFYGLR